MCHSPRLAIATAPSLLLTRDHHIVDAALGTEERAEALKILGTLVEVDALLYGGAHSVALAVRLLGLLSARLRQAAAHAPAVTAVLAVLAVLGLIFAIANPAETVQAARRMIETLKTQGTRLLEISEPAFERRQRAEGELASRLEAPILPRNIESACARQFAVRAGPLRVEELMRVAGPRSPTEAQLTRYLCAHPSFTLKPATGGNLVSLGCPWSTLRTTGPKKASVSYC